MHKRHQIHAPSGMLMWTPCCAQQLGGNLIKSGRNIIFENMPHVFAGIKKSGIISL
jgi:hypothetical protein